MLNYFVNFEATTNGHLGTIADPFSSSDFETSVGETLPGPGPYPISDEAATYWIKGEYTCTDNSHTLTIKRSVTIKAWSIQSFGLWKITHTGTDTFRMETGKPGGQGLLYEGWIKSTEGSIQFANTGSPLGTGDGFSINDTIIDCRQRLKVDSDLATHPFILTDCSLKFSGFKVSMYIRSVFLSITRCFIQATKAPIENITGGTPAATATMINSKITLDQTTFTSSYIWSLTDNSWEYKNLNNWDNIDSFYSFFDNKLFGPEWARTVSLWDVPPIDITFDTGEILVTVQQLIDEYELDKDTRPLKDEDLIEHVPTPQAESLLDKLDSSEYLTDIIGHSCTKSTLDVGAYELEGEYDAIKNRYVDTHPINVEPGNDGYTNILLHLDQDPIVDRSNNRYNIISTGAQVRNNSLVLKGDWALLSACDISLSKGVTAEFYFHHDEYPGEPKEVGYIGFPILAYVLNTNDLYFQINGLSTYIGKTNTWYHIAIEYLNNLCYVFVEGILLDTIIFTDVSDFNSVLCVLGFYSEDIDYNTILMKEFRLSNTLRWERDFTPIVRDNHYEDIGKLGSYYHPTSQVKMESALNQFIETKKIVFNIYGNSETNEASRLSLYNNDPYYIDGEAQLEGFQNDGREGAAISIGDKINATDIQLTDSSTLRINKLKVMWHLPTISTADLNLFNLEETTITASTGKFFLTNSIIDVIGSSNMALKWIYNRNSFVIVGGNTFQARNESINFKSETLFILFANIIEMPYFNYTVRKLIETSDADKIYVLVNRMSRTIMGVETSDVSSSHFNKNVYTDQDMLETDYSPINEEHTIHHHKELVSIADDAMEDMDTILRTTFDVGLIFDSGTTLDSQTGIPYNVFDTLQYDYYNFERKRNNNHGDAGAICLSYTLPIKEITHVDTEAELTEALAPYQNLETFDVNKYLIVPEALRLPLEIILDSSIDITSSTLFLAEIYTGRHGLLKLRGKNIQTNNPMVIGGDIVTIGGSFNLELQLLGIEGDIVLNSALVDSIFRMYSCIIVNEETSDVIKIFQNWEVLIAGNTGFIDAVEGSSSSSSSSSSEIGAKGMALIPELSSSSSSSGSPTGENVALVNLLGDNSTVTIVGNAAESIDSGTVTPVYDIQDVTEETNPQWQDTIDSLDIIQDDT